MTLTASTMLPLGTTAATFKLLEPISGNIKSLEELKSETATVVMFICNHCPFVKHICSELIKVAEDYLKKGVAFIAINSNDPEQYPEDAPKQMIKVAKSLHFPFPYLFDETQEIAKQYRAACTPDLYLFDKNMKCIYRGQFDDSRPNNGIPVTGKDLRAALDAVLSGNPVSPEQKPSMGCNVKWNE